MNNGTGILSENRQQTSKKKKKSHLLIKPQLAYMTVLLFPSMSVNKSIIRLDIAVNQHFYLAYSGP